MSIVLKTKPSFNTIAMSRPPRKRPFLVRGGRKRPSAQTLDASCGSPAGGGRRETQRRRNPVRRTATELPAASPVFEC